MNTRNLGILFLLLTLLISSCSKDDSSKEDSSVSIKTFDVQIINYKSIKSGGVIEASSSSVIQRGVCYAEKPQPTIVDNITKDGVGLGSFNSNVIQLKANTQYYLRAYMVNEKGTFYGNEIPFKTLDYPTKNIWKMNEQIFVINDQSLIPTFVWDNSKKSFIGTDDVSSEVNAISLGFKSKPNASGIYNLVQKGLADLGEYDCNVNIISSRKNYVGQYAYLSSESLPIQVNVSGGKSEIIIPETNIYLVSDSLKTNPIKFSAHLVEK